MSTFQGGLPWIDQESPAASLGWATALLNSPFPQNIHRATQAVPQPPASEPVCRPCSTTPWPARPALSYSPYPLHPSPEARSQGAGCSEDWESQRASPQCLQEHSCVPDFVIDVVFPSLAEPVLLLQQSLVMNTFSLWLKPNMKWPEKLKSFCSEVHHIAHQTRQDLPKP